MMDDGTQKYDNLYYYPKTEEKLNIYTHGLGIILSIIAFILLLIKALEFSLIQGISLFLFGLSQVLLFSASTFYHAQTKPKKRYFANVIDHAMIYVSIAGTYSPLCLIALKHNGGQNLFWFVWACALIGMLLKIRYTGRFNLLSTLMYLAMGWVIVFYWSGIKDYIPELGINFIIAGGIAYTIGAILYSIERIPYNHALFHLCILLGAACHFCTIYYYL